MTERIKRKPDEQAKDALRPPDGNKGAFDALLRRAVPDEADRPEGGTSDPA